MRASSRSLANLRSSARTSNARLNASSSRSWSRHDDESASDRDAGPRARPSQPPALGTGPNQRALPSLGDVVRRGTRRRRSSNDQPAIDALGPGADAGTSSSRTMTSRSNSADLTALDRSARDVARDDDHVAAAAETEGQRRPIVLVVLGEPQTVAKARIEPRLPHDRSSVRPAGLASSSPGAGDHDVSTTRAHARGTRRTGAARDRRRRRSSSDRGSNTMRRPASDLEPHARALGQQPLHHACIEERRREPAVAGPHLERPVEPFGLQVHAREAHCVPRGGDEARRSHATRSGHSGLGVDDAHEAPVVVEARVRARRVPVVGDDDLATVAQRPHAVFSRSRAEAARRNSANAACEQAERVPGCWARRPAPFAWRLERLRGEARYGTGTSPRRDRPGETQSTSSWASVRRPPGRRATNITSTVSAQTTPMTDHDPDGGRRPHGPSRRPGDPLRRRRPARATSAPAANGPRDDPWLGRGGYSAATTGRHRTRRSREPPRRAAAPRPVAAPRPAGAAGPRSRRSSRRAAAPSARASCAGRRTPRRTAGRRRCTTEAPVERLELQLDVGLRRADDHLREPVARP